MKLWISLRAALILPGVCCIGAAQPAGGPANNAVIEQAAPAEVVKAARNAVADLGKQVVLGHYEVAVRRMNPQWKERMAGRMGGEEKMEKQLEEVSKEMLRQGVSIVSFQPQGEARSFEVGPGKKVEVVAGQQVESLIYTKWLVLVPTLTTFRVFNQGKAYMIESTGYQAAISDKGKNDWTFIDGSSLTLNELRKLYINLPQDLKLPPIEKREVR